MVVFVSIVAVIIAVLQATFVPAFKVFGSSADFILPIILIILFFGSKKLAAIFLIISSILVSILSGMPMAFIILPYFIIYLAVAFMLDKRIISKPSTISCLLFVFVASYINIQVQATLLGRLSIGLLVSTISSSFLTAIFSAVVYYFSRRVYFFLNPQILREKIKISHL